jgi:hypothetical protein
MSELRFHTTVGEDRVIHLPEDSGVVPGEVDVIVIQPKNQAMEAESKGLSGKWLLVEDLSEAATLLNICDLPSDLAENHDHYAHGSPKGIDRQ